MFKNLGSLPYIKGVAEMFLNMNGLWYLNHLICIDTLVKVNSMSYG